MPDNIQLKQTAKIVYRAIIVQKELLEHLAMIYCVNEATSVLQAPTLTKPIPVLLEPTTKTGGRLHPVPA